MTTISGRGKPVGYTPLEEGPTNLHVFDVKAIPRANPTVVTMKMVNEDGKGWDKYPQKYDLDTDGGYAAFYYLMLNGYDIDINEDEVNLERDVEDTYVLVDIIHKPKDDGGFYVNVGKTLGAGEPFGTATAAVDDEDDD